MKQFDNLLDKIFLSQIGKYLVIFKMLFLKCLRLLLAAGSTFYSLHQGCNQAE